MYGLRLDLIGQTDSTFLGDCFSPKETQEKETDASTSFDSTILKADSYFNSGKDDFPFSMGYDSSSSSSSTSSFETDASFPLDFEDDVSSSSSFSESDSQFETTLTSSSSRPTKQINTDEPLPPTRPGDVKKTADAPLTKEEQLKIPLQQINAASKKFQEEPYKSQGYSLLRCVNAVIKAYRLEKVVTGNLLVGRLKTYEKKYKEKFPDVQLEENVEAEYHKIPPQDRLVAVSSDSKLEESFNQYQALIKTFSKSKDYSETRCLLAVIKAFNFDIVGHATLKKQYTKKNFNLDGTVKLDDKVKKEYEIYKYAPSTSRSKKPLKKTARDSSSKSEPSQRKAKKHKA